jgi:transcriptional regulator with XRE-family HTH domain
MKKDDVLIKFGKRINQLRTENGWSQEELADKSGFHRTYIGMIERAERNISLRNIEKLAQTFNIEIKNLFE